MKSTILALGLANLANSAPAARRQVPHYPLTSSSQAFKLVANLTDPALDFSPSIKNWLVQGYHTGAGTVVTVNYAYATFEGPDGGYEYNANIPEGCEPISLIPQCDALDPSGASHEFALVEDVAAINWPEYGP